jgi:gas vesicle protein
LVGAALGAVAGVLLAPRAGRDMRRRLFRWMERVEGDLLGEGRTMVDRGKDFARDAAGDARRKVERTLRDIGDKLS